MGPLGLSSDVTINSWTVHTLVQGEKAKGLGAKYKNSLEPLSVTGTGGGQVLKSVPAVNKSVAPALGVYSVPITAGPFVVKLTDVPAK